MKEARLLFSSLYILWILAFILSISGSSDTAIFSYIVLFQFFVPGMVLGASFGLFKRPITEIILFSFIISYLIYLAAALPTLFLRVEWTHFIGLNIFLYTAVLVIFFMKSYKGLSFNLKKPDVQELFIIVFGVVALLLFSYINFRSDASYYNNQISSSLESRYVETFNYNWNFDKEGELTRSYNKQFHHDYQPYFNFLALPLKYSSFDQRYGWFIFNKLFVFLSIIAVYCLGRKLLNPGCGYLSLQFFLINIFIVGFYYRTGSIGASGLIFAQAAYNRHVAENIFLLAFYLVSIEAFRDHRKRSFFCAGLILLSMLSMHYFAFFWASLNFLSFSMIIFAVSLYHTKNASFEFVKLLKSNIYVSISSIIYLLCLFALTDYYSDYAYCTKMYDAYMSDFYGVIRFKKLAFLELIKGFHGIGYILIIISIIAGVPFLIIKIVASRAVKVFGTREIASIFLLSNLLLYLVLRFPVYNTILVNNHWLAWRINGGLLSFVIIAFVIANLSERFNLKNTVFKYTPAVLIIIIFTVFGTDNGFAKKVRYRKNSGYEYLKVTEYFKSIDKPIDGGITIYTDYKSAFDVFANFNVYTVQYWPKMFWPFTISPFKKDLEHLLFHPQEQEEKLLAFLNKNRVDYIILPTKNTLYLKKEDAPNFDEAIKFYSGMKKYNLVYSDKYYYVFKKLKS